MTHTIPDETIQLWQEYIAAEQIRVRQLSLEALDRFIAAVQMLPSDDWHSWARELVMHIIDDHEEVPVRLPLFRSVLFPALQVGLERSMPGCARWLAGFAQQLYHCPSCRGQLPENQQTEYGLLLQAVHDDPKDMRAKTRLLMIMRSRFDYVLHELPSGVLYGHNGATIEQCNELMVELTDYEQLARELGSDDADLELIAQARFYIPAYRQYLSEIERYSSYEQYLSSQELDIRKELTMEEPFFPDVVKKPDDGR